MTLPVYTLHSSVSSKFDFTIGAHSSFIGITAPTESTKSLYLDVFQYIVFLYDTSTLAVAYYNQINPAEDLF